MPVPTQTYIEGLRKGLLALHQPQQAQQMAAYMKNKFEFVGVQSPERRAFQKGFFKQYGYPSPQAYPEVIKALWGLEAREFQYIALDLAVRYFKTAPLQQHTLLVHLITTKSWWDTVDMLATRCAGALLQPMQAPHMELFYQWLHSPNMWLNRTAILFQLHYKTQTNTQLLTEAITKHAGSSEFFIQKAIGWALRHYARTNSAFVVDFCHQHSLAALSRREALKHLGG